MHTKTTIDSIQTTSQIANDIQRLQHLKQEEANDHAYAIRDLGLFVPSGIVPSPYREMIESLHAEDFLKVRTRICQNLTPVLLLYADRRFSSEPFEKDPAYRDDLVVDTLRIIYDASLNSALFVVARKEDPVDLVSYCIGILRNIARQRRKAELKRQQMYISFDEALEKGCFEADEIFKPESQKNIEQEILNDLMNEVKEALHALRPGLSVFEAIVADCYLEFLPDAPEVADLHDRFISKGHPKSEAAVRAHKSRLACKLREEIERIRFASSAKWP